VLLLRHILSIKIILIKSGKYEVAYLIVRGPRLKKHRVDHPPMVRREKLRIYCLYYQVFSVSWGDSSHLGSSVWL